MHPKDAEGIVNSVDPDHTASRSSLIWVCTVCPGLSVRKLRIITEDPDQSALFWICIVCLDLSVQKLRIITLILLRKFPKYSDTQKIWCNHTKICTKWLFRRVMHPKDAVGIANSVDPDQTAPLGLHCLCRPICLSKWHYRRVMHPKDAVGIANSIDLDQE